MANLKPCPFCGAKASMEKLLDCFMVECDACDAGQFAKLTIDEAAAAWNQRADDWQPIATAPKDANFLAYDPNWHDESFGEEGMMALQKSRDGSLITAINRKFLDDEEYFPDGPFEPTHWKPLPTPPESEG